MNGSLREASKSVRRSHLTAEEIAAHAEGGSGPAAETIRTHLSRCAECRGLFVEAVHARARALSGDEPAPVDVALLEVARALPSRLANAAVSPPAPVRPRWRRAGGRLALGGALLAAASLAMVIVGNPPADPLTPAERTALSAAIAQGSQRGMILPGAENAERAGAPSLRSGLTAHASDLAPLVVRLTALVETDRAAAAQFADLASALLVLDRLHDADAVLALGERKFPSDSRLLTLRAVSSYRQGRLDDAERALRYALSHDGRNLPARFDLALLLHETGRAAEAAAVARRLGARESGALLGARVSEIGATR